MYSPLFSLCLIFTFFLLSSATHRRLLHQPLPPTSTPSINKAKPPYPHFHPFFVFFLPPPPPPPPSNDFATFPANISSLILPRSLHSSNNSITNKFIAILVSASILSATFVTVLVLFFFLYHRHPHREDESCDDDHERNDTLRLVSYNTTPSHIEIEKETSSTLVSCREEIAQSSTASNNYVTLNYQRIGSPELCPLPPLPRHQYFKQHHNIGSFEDEDNGFFSPRGSSGGRGSPNFIQRSFRYQYLNYSSSNDSLSNSPSGELSLAKFPALPRFILQQVEHRPMSSSSISSGSTHNSPASQIPSSSLQNPVSTMSKFGYPERYVSRRLPPPPPLPPPRVVIENDGPSMPVSFHSADGESIKPKLKPLHWDKVRANSDKAMVWDQLKSNSFQLNEEMIETLFTINSSNLNSKDGVRLPIIPVMNQEKQLLDLKKSQNIAILLRALQITSDEVCEALLEGSADTLGMELLESLIKMAPTKEEERKLKNIKDESPFKLGPAEKFLKAVVDIPFAFKRVDAMLYIACFDSEIEYLKGSFQTLEIACEELRNSRTFLRLLEAVLRTGNRMNMGTDRGDARAFKLDTLLKLVDIKGADGKTTLLHFVLHETIRAEGSHLSDADLTSRDEAEFRNGVHVISALSHELANVKKAAVMDSDILSNEVAKLAAGVAKITDVIKLNQGLVLDESSRKFSESMNGFLKKAEGEIMNIQAQEEFALSMVNKLTEYFYGDLAKEEARRIRIFMVVKDFLSIIDQVCTDLGK
ncbi:formin-like protein 2 [Solanum stenotomum]|uniref:formin-like protein 2 n=1 Tax=Solanum stenotomum TaxID=172797 RepID=UPI0020D16D77|nr:formin-like protein 2 [Solanum stenotomum]